MTKFVNKTFTVPVGGKKFRDGWEAVFGKKASVPKKAKTTGTK